MVIFAGRALLWSSKPKSLQWEATEPSNNDTSLRFRSSPSTLYLGDRAMPTWSKAICLSMAALSEQNYPSTSTSSTRFPLRNLHAADPAAVEVLEAVADLIRQLWRCNSRTVFGLPCVWRYFRVAQTTCETLLSVSPVRPGTFGLMLVRTTLHS